MTAIADMGILKIRMVKPRSAMKKLRDEQGRFVPVSNLRRKVTVRLEEKIYDEFKSRAAKQNITIAEYVRSLLQESCSN